jgi:phosphoribosylanthranilate isomerase
MVWVKICGITNLEDAEAAVEAGADAVGFVFCPSPRCISPKDARDIVSALPRRIQCVGVFVNAGLNTIREIKEFCGLDLVQLHGQEPPEMIHALGGGVIKAMVMRVGTAPEIQHYPTATILLDTYDPQRPGGTGRPFDWRLAAALSKRRRVILAGGLNARNVQRAIEMVRPYGVDVSSGVESSPGRKDHEEVRLFVQRAKGASHGS